MSIDEQVQSFMRGWGDGVMFEQEPPAYETDAYKRGFHAGQEAYLAAEKAERERLTRCPDCFGTGWYEGRTKVCPTCHGTRRRA